MPEKIRPAFPSPTGEPARRTTEPNGPIAATLLAAGIGCLALAVMVILAAASPTLSAKLNWAPAVGPLSGKTLVALAIWLLAWLVLHLAWRRRHMNLAWVYVATLVLIGLGLLGTFPPFYDLFGG